MQSMCVQDIFCKILSDTQKIEKMNSLSDQSKIYDLFCKNGYDKSFDEFRIEMDDFLNSEDIKKIMNDNFGELSDEMLELVSGGFSIKLTAKVGIATLMSAFTIASSVGPASATTIAPTPASASVTVESDYNYGKPKLNDGFIFNEKQISVNDKQQLNKGTSENKQQINKSTNENKQQLNKGTSENKQQINKSTNENKQQINKSTNENKQQINKSTSENKNIGENKQQLSKSTNENEQQINKNTNENEQQLSKSTNENEQQINKNTNENEQQLSKSTNENKQQINKSTNENKQQINKSTNENKQQINKSTSENKNIGENKQQLSKSTNENEQQINKNTNENEQQLSKSTNENKQQINKSTNENKQQLNKGTSENKQQISESTSDAKQQLSNGPLDFRIKDDKGTIGTAIKAENEQNSILPLVYNDNYFSESSMKYNKSLAAASLALELSGFADHSEIGKEYTAQHKNAEDALIKLEFVDIKANEAYTSKPGKDTIGVMTACKETKINGEDVAIIPVVIRGGGYELEWFSNTDVGETGNQNNHNGFESAANSAKSYIKGYLKDIKGKIGDKKIKLWIVGYSRGGATAGMLAKSIDDDIRKDLNFGGFNLKHDDVYCYAFEAPKGLNKVNSVFESNSGDFVSFENNLYKNIHNVLNSKDIVTHVAPGQWDFVRPGVEHRLDEKEGQDNNQGMKDILNSFLINSDKKNAHPVDLKEGNDKLFNNLGGESGYSAKVVKSLDDAISGMRKLAKKGNVKLPKNINNNRDFYSKIVQKTIGKVISLAMGSKEFKEELSKEISKPLISHEDGPLDVAKKFKDWWEYKDGTVNYGRTDTIEKGYFSDYLDTNYFYSIGEYIKFCGTAKSLDGHTERKASRAICLTINRVIDRLIEKHKSEPEYKNYLEGCKMKLVTQYEKIDSKSDAKYQRWFSHLKSVEEKIEGGSESEKTTSYAQGKSEDELKKDLEIFRDVNARESDGYYVKGSWFGGYLNYVDQNDEVVDEAVMADLIRTLFIALYKNSSNLTEYAQTMDYVVMASAEMHKPELHLAQLVNEDTDNTKLYQNLNSIIKFKYNKDEKNVDNAVTNMKKQGYKYQLRKDKADINWNDMEESEAANYRS